MSILNKLNMKEIMDEKNKKNSTKSHEKFTQTLPNTNQNNKLIQTDRITMNVAFTQTNLSKENEDININEKSIILAGSDDALFEPFENMMDTEDDFLTYTKPRTSKSTISVINQIEQLKSKKKTGNDVYEKFAKTLRNEPDEDIPRTKNPTTDIYRNKNFQYKSDNQALNDFFQNNLENYINKGKSNLNNKSGLSNSKTSTKGLFYLIFINFLFQR
jgi:hypothetical protein